MIIENAKARWAIVILVVVGCLILLVPNFVNLKKETWWPTHRKLVYGLDIQGGLHLVMGVDIEGVFSQYAKNLSVSLPNEVKTEKQIDVGPVEMLNPVEGSMKIAVKSSDDAKRLEDFIGDRYSQTLQVVESSSNFVQVKYFDAFVRDTKKSVVERSIETIRNRIDEFGVAEPSIVAQGDDRILIQLPGVQESSAAKELINKTARLDFMIVSNDMDPYKVSELIAEAEKAGQYALGKDDMKYSKYLERLNADLKGKLPKDTQVFFGKAPNATNLESGKVPYLLSTVSVVSGSRLRDASSTLDPQTGGPVVLFEFNSEGAKEFGTLTENNIGRNLATVLDNVVQVAPVIQSKISKSGQITMGAGADQQNSAKEANLVAMALRSGALPAALEQLEERTVGPTLGADSVAQGKKAGLVGAALVFLFMLFYYKGFGVVTNICIALNVMMTLAILSGLGATLTLPGIAGLALTVGMAVDANIIINERIKEEMAKGASLSAAVRIGYSRAFAAILDGNLTSVAICVVLLYFGTGPIKGFAVSLLIGLVCSQFSSVFFSRTVVDHLVNKLKMKLSI